MSVQSSKRPAASSPLSTFYSLLSTLYFLFRENPVILQEFRRRMRGWQSFALLLVYLLIISVLTLLIYSLLGMQDPTNWGADYRQGVGKAVFGTVVLLELILVTLIGPSLTAGAIAGERERQTLELLRTTLLSARALVGGKLSSALAFLFLLIFSALPIQSIAFLLGGVELAELLIASLMLAVTAIFFCSLGLFFSSFMRRTSGATIVSYVTILLASHGGGVLFGWVAISASAYVSKPPSFLLTIHDIFLSIIVWMLISTNPILAAIFSEVVLVNEQNLFYTNVANNSFLIMTSNFYNFYLPSPWIIFTVVYLFLAFLLVWGSVHFVKQPAR